MIYFGNKSFSGTAAIAAQALLIALTLKEFRPDLDYVSRDTFHGLLADDAGYLQAIFVSPFGGISKLLLSESMFTSTTQEIREAERMRLEEREREAECRRLVAEIRSLEFDRLALIDQVTEMDSRLYAMRQGLEAFHGLV